MARIQIRWRVLALAALFVPAVLAAPGRPTHAGALPPGYFVDYDEARDSNDRPISIEDAGDAFTVSVRRAAEDSLSAWLLAVAESTYPDRATLVTNALDHRWEMGPDTAHAVVWWSRGVGPNRIPHAVTWRGVLFYADLTAHYRAHFYLNSGTRAPNSSELTYWSTIEKKDRFELAGFDYRNVYVANLHLFWGIDDGAFDMNTTAHRVVVLDPSGQVLQVQGDEPADESVMISGWREATRHMRRRH